MIRGVDDVVPRQVRSLYSSLRDAVRSYDFPEVFGPLVPTRVRNVPAPDPTLLQQPGGPPPHGRRSSRSPVWPTSCARRVEGSGFVYAADRIITNAHVVAGVDQPVGPGRRRARQATVVLYDPERDVAVLHVPDLGLRPLSFAAQAGRHERRRDRARLPGGRAVLRRRGPDPGPDGDPRTRTSTTTAR